MHLPTVIQLRQQAPFRYTSAVESLDLTARTARVGLHLAPSPDTFDFLRGTALPGLLLVEAMAQACGILLRQVSTGEDAGFLVGVEQGLLPDEVPYPAQVWLQARLTGAASPIFLFDASATSRRDGVESCLAEARLQIRSSRQLS